MNTRTRMASVLMVTGALVGVMACGTSEPATAYPPMTRPAAQVTSGGTGMGSFGTPVSTPTPQPAPSHDPMGNYPNSYIPNPNAQGATGNYPSTGPGMGGFSPTDLDPTTPGATSTLNSGSDSTNTTGTMGTTGTTGTTGTATNPGSPGVMPGTPSNSTGTTGTTGTSNSTNRTTTTRPRSGTTNR